MGYTPYKAQRMQSPMTQKSKSGDKDENRKLTLEQLAAQNKSKYNATMDSMSNEQSAGNLGKGEWDAQNKKSFDKYTSTNKAQSDSINSVINTENLANQARVDSTNKSNQARVDSTNASQKEALRAYNAGEITLNEAKSKGLKLKK